VRTLVSDGVPFFLPPFSFAYSNLYGFKRFLYPPLPGKALLLVRHRPSYLAVPRHLLARFSDLLLPASSPRAPSSSPLPSPPHALSAPMPRPPPHSRPPAPSPPPLLLTTISPTKSPSPPRALYPPSPPRAPSRFQPDLGACSVA